MSEANNLPRLPKSWVWTTIGEIAPTASGGTPSRGHTDYYGGTIPWVKSGELKDGTVFQVEEFITELAVRSSSAKIFPAGTLCIALYGATVGRLGLLGIEAATNQAVCGIFVPRLVVTQYLFHYLFWQRRNLIELGKGGAQPNISQDIVRRTAVPLPPFPEQQRIVAKIEELFTKLDVGVNALKKARAQLGRYRQSILKAAVTGELTREWREAHRDELEPASDLLARILQERRAKWEADQLAKMQAAGKPPKNDDWKQKYQEPAAPDTSELPTLPEDWMWSSLESILTDIKAGKSFKCEERPPAGDEVGVVKVSAVTWGEFNEGESKTCIDRSLIRADFYIKEGDFLFSRANTIQLVGACVIVKHVKKQLMLSDKILRFSFLGISAMWLLIALRSQHGRSEIERLATGNQESMRNIGQDRIQQIRIPLPSLAEQQQIVSEVERLLSIADAMEQTIEQSLKQAERLRQSILQQAFAGKLVPQDPNDEPAKKLLARIKAERQQNGNAPQKSRRPTRKQKQPIQPSMLP